MTNNKDQHAEVALARFKVQAYNWNKQNKTLMEIYGVGEAFVKKMKREVGIVPIKERCAEARRLFKCHPEHYNLPSEEVAKIYGVTDKFAAKMIGEFCGNRQAARVRKLDNLILNHPNFGVPGQHATVSHRALADELGVSQFSVGSRRRLKGVLTYKIPKDWLSEPEKRTYELCKLTRTWGRPAGIDEHLQMETA